MVATDANIDSFVQNSMAFIRKYNFDGIDIGWLSLALDGPASCPSPENCSPPSDAERFKVLLEKFRSAIESENVLPADKMIISSMAGTRKNQIYKVNDDTSTISTAELNSITSSISLQDLTAMNSNETTFFDANSTKVSPMPNESSDLKVEIWAPVLAFILLVVIVLIVWRVKRANAKVTKNSVRSDRKAHDENLDDTAYENYGNDIQFEESNYSQPYTAYDGYEEYEGHYAGWVSEIIPRLPKIFEYDKNFEFIVFGILNNAFTRNFSL